MDSTPQSSDPTAAHIEEITPGVTAEWLYNGAILAVTMQGKAHHEAMRIWHEWMQNTIQQWPDEKPFLMLIDPSKSPMWTPQMREQAETFRRDIESRLKARVAVVVSAPSFMVMAMSMFMRSGRNKSSSRLFDNREKALAWLKEFAPNRVE